MLCIKIILPITHLLVKNFTSFGLAVRCIVLLVSYLVVFFIIELVIIDITDVSAQTNDAREEKKIITLPENLTWVGLDSQSLNYAQGVSISNILRKKYNTEIRIIPVRNGVSRVIPLVSGKAQMMFTGTDGYIAQEGVFIYAKEGFGPRKLRLLMINEIQPGNGLAVAGDIGVNRIKDLRGKTISVIQGSAGGNLIIKATLAFGGLSWDDVDILPVPNYRAAYEAVINYQADASQANVMSGIVERWANSPRGMIWPELPHEDEEGWTRLFSVTPYTNKALICDGVGIPENECLELQGYGFPTWVAMSDLSADLVYNFAKAIFNNAEKIAEEAPRAHGYQLELQRLMNSMPWHEGVVRLFKEKGIWDDKHEEHHQMLLFRQEVLSRAWENFNVRNTNLNEVQFGRLWSKARKEALKKNGLPIIYNNAYNLFK